MELLQNWDLIAFGFAFALWLSRTIAGTKTRQEDILEAIKASKQGLSAEHIIHDKALTEAVSRLEHKLDQHIRAHEIEAALDERVRVQIEAIEKKLNNGINDKIQRIETGIKDIRDDQLRDNK